MADYREISQGYAQGAIRAVILVNSGAAVALLSQIPQLLPLLSHFVIGASLIAFVAGVFLGIAAWVWGFYNARYVDLAERMRIPDYSVANKMQHWGAVSLASGALCFLGGCVFLAVRFILAGSQ